ncbi:MAG: trypsin-like peptidase domain-containing protein [Pirellulales bacterium]|nr:trypsin-like peptidase domain-containing protein [Pirellulales bacterium]
MNDSTESPQPSEPRPVYVIRETAPRRSSGLFWVLLFLLVLLAIPYLVQRITYGVARGREAARAEVARELLDELPDEGGVYPWVAKAIEPSVVGIDTISNGQAGVAVPADEWSHMFRVPQQPYFLQGKGSGVIVDAEGHIVTNAHVIRGAVAARVKLSDGRTFNDVKVVGADSPSDLAVLKIDATDLTPAPWGDSDAVDVGDPVLAVGNPFGLERTVTAGIISAKNRKQVVPGLDYQNFLQTDAAVNPGNSGGPLVNLKGQVVGINTAIHGASYQGISFAIPSNMARDIVDKLKTGGQIARGWLGVSITELTGPLAKQLGIESDTPGAVVTHILPNSPAAAAGIEPGDIIVQWADTPIAGPGELGMAAAGTPIGSTAKVIVLRKGKRLELDVKVGQRPDGLR